MLKPGKLALPNLTEVRHDNLFTISLLAPRSGASKAWLGSYTPRSKPEKVENVVASGISMLLLSVVGVTPPRTQAPPRGRRQAPPSSSLALNVYEESRGGALLLSFVILARQEKAALVSGCRGDPDHLAPLLSQPYRRFTCQEAGAVGVSPNTCSRQSGSAGATGKQVHAITSGAADEPLASLNTAAGERRGVT